MTDDVSVWVNGHTRRYESGLRIPALITDLLPIGAGGGAAPFDGVAVAVNGVVVPRAHWQQRPINPGDRVEIVTAVQGG